VARADARLIVTDFHPAAIAAGHRRRFKDAQGVSREVEHHVHLASDHARAALAAGWVERRRIDAPAAEPERSLYERAGRPDLFEAGRAQPLVLALAFSR
jgi:malonyl-CoA O-methyltransferase